MPETRRIEFSPLIFEPDRARGERVNIGIVVFDDEQPIVRLTSNLAKVAALAPGYNIAKLRKLPQQLSAEAGRLSPEQIATLLHGGLGPVRALRERGTIFLAAGDNLETELRTLLSFICDTGSARKPPAPPRGRLFNDLRRLFKQAGVLGEHVGDIYHHLVPHFPINEDAAMFAEFAVKNGRFHVTETIDVRAVSRPKHNEAGAKALLLHESRRQLGADTQRYAVVAADHWREASPILATLEPYCDHLIDFRDGNAMRDYLAAMSAATGKPLEMAIN